MRRHDVVQTCACGLKAAASFGVVIPTDQTHKLRHCVAVVPRGAEGALLDKPAWREDDKIGDSGAHVVGGTGEDSVDGRVRVIERSAANDGEAAEIVLVRVVCGI